MRMGDVRLVADAATAKPRQPVTARAWLARTQAELGTLLPDNDGEAALLTEDLVTPAGDSIDVYQYFDEPTETLESVFANYHGLIHSAQVSGTDSAIDEPAPAWTGYEEVWIPIRDDFALSGRLSVARNQFGDPLHGPCVVILPGLLGDNAIRRTRDVGNALRANGIHSLALELRGVGQTEGRYPDVHYTFGVLETCDLIRVSEWLRERPYVSACGLMGFCWGGNQALLSAWADGRTEDDVSEELRPFLSDCHAMGAFEAGVMAFSPVLRFEEVIESLEHDQPMLLHPVRYTLQEGVQERIDRKGYEDVKHGSLRGLIAEEVARSELISLNAVPRGLDYLRFLPFHDLPAPPKLDQAVTPVLIVHAANDPLAGAQDVADLISITPNPNVAAIILPGGGHNGFAPYARAYFYSLIVNFYSDQGPAQAGSS